MAQEEEKCYTLCRTLNTKSMKTIAVIGAGAVGSHICAAGILKNLPADFLLVDLNETLESGEVLDLRDSLLFSDSKNISGANFGDQALQNADIFVITAGVAQKPGETRCELLAKNAKILSGFRFFQRTPGKQFSVFGNNLTFR